MHFSVLRIGKRVGNGGESGSAFSDNQDSIAFFKMSGLLVRQNHYVVGLAQIIDELRLGGLFVRHFANCDARNFTDKSVP